MAAAAKRAAMSARAAPMVARASVRRTAPRAAASSSDGPASDAPGTTRSKALRSAFALGAAAALGVGAPAALPPPALARLEGVNKPELLPDGPVVPVVDVAGYLTQGEIKRLTAQVEGIEEDLGIKVRVLAQNYPETPGLAVRDYWGVDDDTIVFVADPTLGNILNFNVGSNVDLAVPQSFWTRLAGKYGTPFYFEEAGPEASIVNAVSAINSCLREEEGRGKCSTILGEFDEENAPRKKKGLFGMF